MKVYFCCFVHKRSSKHLFKFGITNKNDVLERFSIRYDKRYGDFNIHVLCSIDTTQEEATFIEGKLLQMCQKNVYLESYFNMPNGYFNGMSGITEFVYLEDQAVKIILDALYKIKKEK